MRTNHQFKGIFCIEGNWDNDLTDSKTVRPILEMLSRHSKIPYIHRDCATREELSFYLSKWIQRKYDRYPILYLATHGESNCLDYGDFSITLDELAQELGTKCQNRVIICGSCSTMKIDKRKLKNFLKDTKALSILGYKRDVDWLRATAFELLLMDALQDNEFSKRGIPAIMNRAEDISRSFKDLDFRFVSL